MAEQSTNKSSAGNTRLVILGTIIVGIIGAGVILLALTNRPTGQTDATNSAAIIEGEVFTGIEPVDPPHELTDFTLTDQNNQPISLSDLHGKMALMLFGYTNCPDVCPSTLLNYKQIKKALSDQADQIAFVFISVDGGRDTPEVIKNYLGRFDEDFIGMTGDEATLNELGTDYNLYVEKSADASGSSDNYLVTHNSNTYLVDKDGRLVALYIYGTEPDVIAADILTRLAA